MENDFFRLEISTRLKELENLIKNKLVCKESL